MDQQPWRMPADVIVHRREALVGARIPLMPMAGAEGRFVVPPAEWN
jgi:hypothetical protein